VAPVSRDRRPAALALGLAGVFLLLLLVPAGRTLFDLVALRPTAIALVLAAAGAWLLLVRTVWHLRLLQRFIGT
jgi:hypothetical protein